MDNKEMNRIVAEKVHGWHRQPWNAWNKDAKPLYGFWADEKDTFQESLDGYDPATNIAQAFEAAEAFRIQHGDAECRWTFYSPMGGDSEYEANIILNDPDSKKDYHRINYEGDADTPAQAITEALVKAVSDE